MKNIVFNNQVLLEEVDLGVTRKVLAHSKNMMIVEVNFKQGAVGTAHTHVHEQVAYIVSGKFEFSIEQEQVTVAVGDSIYFKPNQLHGVKCLEPGTILDTFTPMRDDFIN